MTSEPVRRWDIWQVNWRHEDGTAKPRPVVVLHIGHPLDSRDALLVCRIQSTEHDHTRICLDPGDGGAFAVTGLTKRCFAYPGQVRVIALTALLRRRGTLIQPYRRRVERILRGPP